METTAFVLEVGCEEIPARFLAGAERELGERLSAALAAARIAPRARDGALLTTASTPRRLLAYAPAILQRQPDRAEQLLGPPVKAAFDREGKPTRAAESFAAKNRAALAALKRVNTPKGEYLALEVSEVGRTALEVLTEALPAAIGAMTFPKNMYWTTKSLLFVRPIRWILALLDAESGVRVIPFEFAGVRSGSLTYGHRSRGNEPIAVSDLNLDLLLEKHLVVVRRTDRRERVKASIKALLEDRDFVAPADDFLEEWAVNSTEWPVPLMGRFDPRYLSLPREVLVTVMRDHQKYFAVEDRAGALQAEFIAVLNVPGDAKGLIRQGHERVLAARFADAEFFWNADQKISLAHRAPLLERVTYQAKLGTYGDKVRRMRQIAERICQELDRLGSMNSRERQHALRAVELCKCDLTSQMVQEFTELQGVIGGLYARTQGEAPEVSDAIYDHYRPRGLEDSSPRTKAGAAVSLADKLDTVVAGFSARLEPSGSSDPFGLRRAGNGIVKVSVEVLPGFDLFQSAEAITAVNLGLPERGDLWAAVAKFLRERVEYYLETVKGLRYDTVRAVVRGLGAGGGWSVPSNAAQLGTVLEAMRDGEEFMALSQAARRTRNILKKSATLEDFGVRTAVDEGLLTAGPERELYDAYQDLGQNLGVLQAQSGYREALLALGRLRPYVDRFFDAVLVMDNNPELRSNRLRLLAELNAFAFTSLADLSEIVVDSDVDASTSKPAPGQS